MDKTGSFVLTFCAGFTALIWRLAVANFISLAAFKRPYPLPEAVLALCLAALIGAATRRRGWRVITVIGLHGFGLAVAILKGVYAYHLSPHSFVSLRWITHWIDAGPDINAWLALVLQSILAIGFWWGGSNLIRRQESIRSHYARFDIGLAAFFVLFLVKFIIWHRSGVEIQDFLSEKLLIAFMIFGLLAIAMARHRGTARTQFISGKKIIGITLGATAVVVLFATGLVVFFLPYMTAAADFGYTVLRTVSGPLGAVFIAILRFMFTSRHLDQDLVTPAQKPVLPATPGDATAENCWWVDLIEKAGGYLVVGIGTAVLLAATIALAWLLGRWLWHRTPAGDQNRNRGDITDFLAVFKALVLQLVLIYRMVSSFFRPSEKTGTAFFVALLKWGRRSGMPLRTGETPIEYAQRLEAGFPMVGSEIGTIVDLFNREKYGGRVLDLHRLDLASASWKKLRSPLRWGRRLRTWFLQQGDRS